jgi:hypothetical protein
MVLKWVLQSRTRSHRRAPSLQMTSHAIVQPKIESDKSRGRRNYSPDPALATGAAVEQNSAFAHDAGEEPYEGENPDASIEPDESVEPDPTEWPDVSTESEAAYIT